jgi:hypothetical protein
MSTDSESFRDWKERTRPTGPGNTKLVRIQVSRWLVIAAIALVLGSLGFALFCAIIAGCLALRAGTQPFAAVRPDTWKWLAPALEAATTTAALVAVFANDSTRDHWWVFVAILLVSQLLELGLRQRRK